MWKVLFNICYDPYCLLRQDRFRYLGFVTSFIVQTQSGYLAGNWRLISEGESF